MTFNIVETCAISASLNLVKMVKISTPVAIVELSNINIIPHCWQFSRYKYSSILLKMLQYHYHVTLLTSFQKYLTTLNFYNALYIIKANTLELNSFKNHIRQPNELKKKTVKNPISKHICIFLPFPLRLSFLHHLTRY